MLVERSGQLMELQELFAQTVAGNGRVATVGGPVGSGKTELLRTFADHVVGSGAVFIDAVAARSERTIPNGVLRQLVRKAALPPATTARVWALLDAPVANQNDGFDEVSYSLRSIGDALLHVAENSPHPLVIGVDDLHYADVPSLQSLLYVIRRFQSTRMMLVF